jgi:hypothetical protein
MHSRCRLASLWERQRQIGANFSTVVYEGFEAVNVCGGPCLGAFKAGGRVTCLLPGRYQLRSEVWGFLSAEFFSFSGS